MKKRGKVLKKANQIIQIAIKGFQAEKRYMSLIYMGGYENSNDSVVVNRVGGIGRIFLSAHSNYAWE